MENTMQQPTPQQAIQYLAQVAESRVALLQQIGQSDLIPLARQQAQAAIELLAKAIAPKPDAEPLPEHDNAY